MKENLIFVNYYFYVNWKIVIITRNKEILNFFYIFSY